MANLLDAIKSYLTPELLGQAANLLGENENSVAKAAGGMAPAILAGILNKANDENTMEGIFGLLSDSKNAGFLDNLGGLIGGGNLAHNDPKDAAGNLMGMLFGGKVNGILNALSAFSGMKSGSTSTLLGMVGPLVMGVLGKKISAEGLNASGLLNLLTREKSSIMGALPGGLSSVMGLAASMGNTSGAETTQSTGNRWLWPLLLLLGLGGGIVYYMKNCAAQPNMSEMATQPVTVAPAPDTTEAVVVGFMKKLASGFELKGNSDGIESQLIAFVEDAQRPVDKTTWFNFDRLLFETGSAKIDMDKSADQLANMVEILNAYPKVKLKIGGYTDNTGSEANNMKLSAARAKAVVDYLVAEKIAASRLAGEGYGSQHPVASNDTEEGRAQNRRIAVRVTEK